MKSRDFKGVWIPKEIWLSKELTLREKVLLVEIDSLYKNGSCFATNKYFAEFFGLSRTRISKVINTLVDKSFLKIEYTNSGRRTLTPLSTKVQTPFEQKFKPLSTKVQTDLNNTNNNTNNIYSFQEFYDDYGKKVSRSAAERAFSKLKEEDLKKIKEVLPQWKKQYVKEKDYQPHPSTWLNQRRWEDDLKIDNKNVYRRDYKILK